MSINEKEIGKLIDLHNRVLEDHSNLKVPLRKIASIRAAFESPSPVDIITGKFRKLALVYFSLALLFTFLSFALINFAGKRDGLPDMKNLKVELFRSDYKGGIVYAFNRVIK